MKLLSVNVGEPRTLEVKGRWGRPVRTGIFKTPVEGRVRVGRLNVAGDAQADLSVHGGPEKAVYVYPWEHYDRWQAELTELDFPVGAFGENFTVEGLLEGEVRIGDRLRIGTAEFVVTQPRMPCFKLGVRFGQSDMVKRFLASRRTGFYLAVTAEGEVGAGDSIVWERVDGDSMTVLEITELYASKQSDPAALRRASTLSGLPADWREWFRERAEQAH